MMRSFRSVLTFLALALIICPLSNLAAQDKKVALVIGNSNYSTGPLRNPANDAADVAAALRDIGFSVALSTDASRKTMYHLIEQFGSDIRGADIALFYYSGHGVQAGGENYLIPIGADISIASDVETEGVQLQRLIGRMDAGGAGTNIVILDACRNNPFPEASRGMERGLAVIERKPPESVIVYATEAGETADDGDGRNGVFTTALLRNIRRNEEFTNILRDVNAEVRKDTNQEQRPGKYDNLTHEVYLAGRPEGRATTLSTVASAAIRRQVIGLSFSDFAIERWPRERDQMTTLLKAAGYDVLVQEANHDAKLQNDQVKNMVTQGAKVIIAVAEDGDSMATAVDEVAKKGVKVIAYDRLIKSPNVAAYVSFDNVDVGRNQAKGVIAVKSAGNFVLLGGSPTDNNAHLFRQGQMEILQPFIDSGKIKVVADQWVENWDPANAEMIMENIITATRGRFDAVVASNDGTALGALEAMRTAGMAGKVPISGQDATEAGCNSIARGELTVTILKDTRKLTPIACDLADKLAKKQAIPDLKPYALADLTGDKTKTGQVPCEFLQVFQVTKDNLKQLVVDSGFQTYEGVYAGVPGDFAGLVGMPDGLYAHLTTSRGEILIQLEYQKAPLTVGNFIGLAEGRMDASKGRRYFDGLSFHRVVADFVVQSGDPKGDGSGGPGYEFPNETSNDLKYDAEGVVGMANAGPNTNGSQFFITMKAVPELDGGYTIFGKVVKGMDVVKQIAQGDKLVKVEILRNGSDARAFKADQAAFDSRLAPLAAAIKKATEDKRGADIAAIKQRWPDLVADADGIYQKTVRAGSGASPAAGQTVSVSYKGMLVTGQIFDQSEFHGGPVDFQVGVGKIIPGWDKVIMQMKKGEKRMIVIPPELAYGSRGTPGGPIAPDSFLAFELELVDLK